jgi:DNA-binding PadR family transcriptional regulator
VGKSRGPMTEAMFYVLLALQEPQHGYALMSAVAEISRGRVAMGPGTLYGVLSRMQKERLIALDEDDGRRKAYRLTSAGQTALRQELQRLQAMVEDGQRQMGGSNW